MNGDNHAVREMLHAGEWAAAVGAALELGLFWFIAGRPCRPDEIARRLEIPVRRCEHWLEMLRAAGLVERTGDGYGPTAWARAGILGTWSQDTWSLLATEAREAATALVDLPTRLMTGPRSTYGPRLPNYVRLMNADPVRARRFSRMLFELHASLAERLARDLPLHEARSLLDIGGGSGVVSIALAHRYPNLAIVVVDIPNVCIAGREIVADHGLGDRIRFEAADLTEDGLPGGFDAAIECDVGLYDVGLFERVRAALGPGGTFIIVDELAPDDAAPVPHLSWAFLRSLDDPEFAPATVHGVVGMLRQAGFSSVSRSALAEDAEGREREGSATMAIIIASA